MTINALPASGNITRLTVLALLSWQPMHGYQLRQEISLRRMERWANIKTGSIYQALRKLNTEGLVEELGESRAGNRPSRMTYQITPQGRTTLNELLRSAWAIPQGMADPVEVALSFVMLLQPQEVALLIEQRLSNINDLQQELINEQQHITQSPTGIKLMISDLFAHRLSLLEAEKKWTQTIFERVTTGQYSTT